MANIIDTLEKTLEIAETNQKLFSRAIDLLQSVCVEIDGNGEVSLKTITNIEKLLDENYKEALK